MDVEYDFAKALGIPVTELSRSALLSITQLKRDTHHNVPDMNKINLIHDNPEKI